MARILLSCFMLVSLLSGCAKKCEVKDGIYDDGILKITTSSNGVQKGVINISQGQPNIECNIYFQLNASNTECIKEIVLMDWDNNKCKAYLEVRDKNIYIKSEESLFPCQRIIDLNGGVEFFFEE
ncbi:hypothetical protein [Reichenbachiella versicolor]|uniref:hypothetical protein n=1 Tax=Reichenbachiella versicolor TaxID=1821036 RepID=UPI0013A5573B|nr:hypothetical protein [Reichenbachiella versicolor]